MNETSKDLNNQNINNPVLFIPRVYSNINESRIRHIFNELNMGELDRINIVGKRGDKYNRVFIHYRYWNNSENAEIVRDRLLNGKEVKVIYDDPWFWKISAYREYDQNKHRKIKITES